MVGTVRADRLKALFPGVFRQFWLRVVLVGDEFSVHPTDEPRAFEDEPGVELDERGAPGERLACLRRGADPATRDEVAPAVEHAEHALLNGARARVQGRARQPSVAPAGSLRGRIRGDDRPVGRRVGRDDPGGPTGEAGLDRVGERLAPRGQGRSSRGWAEPRARAAPARRRRSRGSRAAPSGPAGRGGLRCSGSRR